jgi:hypothetical protein
LRSLQAPRPIVRASKDAEVARFRAGARGVSIAHAEAAPQDLSNGCRAARHTISKAEIVDGRKLPERQHELKTFASLSVLWHDDNTPDRLIRRLGRCSHLLTMSLVGKDSRSSFQSTVSGARNLRKVSHHIDIAKYFLLTARPGHTLQRSVSRCRSASASRPDTRPVELDGVPKMPRYFFHVTNGVRSFDDREGEILPGVAAAEAKAAQIARELAADREAYCNYRVVVTDDTGSEIGSREIAVSYPANGPSLGGVRR